MCLLTSCIRRCRLCHLPTEKRCQYPLGSSGRVSDAANSHRVIDILHLLSKGQMKGSLLDELWDAHFIDRNVSLSIQALLASEDPALIRIIRKNTKGITSTQVRVSLK